jgi:crotonobetainyl-CoA:carnitine CoA-transferase CaiB-like acyl-CoA transferase
VLDVSEVVNDADFGAPGAVVTVTHPKQGEFAQLGPLLAGMDRRVPSSVPDMSDTDTERLLKEAGVDAETVTRWLHEGVVA